MLHPRHARDGAGKRPPRVALRVQNLATVGGEPVVPPPALAGFLHPASLNPAPGLEPVQLRIEGGDLELNAPFGPDLDQPGYVVAMARLLPYEREDEQFRASLLQFPVEHPSPVMLHSDILHCD